jgi:gas vesicle protein GvpN
MAKAAMGASVARETEGAAGAAARMARALADHLSQPARADAATLKPREDLFEDQGLASLQERALRYLRAGVPVHLRGPAGTGKTTLAVQIAARLGRPAILVTGDGWFTAGHLTGRETGQRTRQVVDRFIHSVKKIESETERLWSDDPLTKAILNGYTLVYDEFTRSPPEANNPLLMAFEERMLILPGGQREERYVRAHPDFRAILTSNPVDYAGVAAPQDALIDRMISFDLDEHDRSTEIGIVANRSGLEQRTVAPVVDLLRKLRLSGLAAQAPSLRSAIQIASIAAADGLKVDPAEPRFAMLVRDVLQSKAPPVRDRAARAEFYALIEKALADMKPAPAGRAA